jgi:beta-phosphoglucomutase-like phosphatase (HAD superfamily)
MSRPQVTAVICDLDGLLFDSERRTRHAWQVAMRSLGHELDDGFYTTLIGRKIAISENMVAERFSVDVRTFRDAWRGQHHQLAVSGPVPPRPGALELIAWLEQRRIPRAIATSSIRADAERTLGSVINCFPIVISGDQVTRGKPDPEIYLAAAAALGIAPDQCAALEDSEPGIAAAHAAGMRAMMVPDLKQPSAEILAIAHGVYPSLLEARQEIERLMR